MIPSECGHCGSRLRVAGVGRPNRYCSTRCRVAAHRASQVYEVPAVMRARPRWVRWAASACPLRCGDGKAASSTDPRTWSTWDEALSSTHGLGVGFVLDGDGIVCVDLDHCLDGGRLADWAARIVAAAPATYIEVSKSGTGLHLFGLGSVGKGRVIRRDGAAVEVYGTARYIAVTGKRWRRAPLKLADLQGLVDTLV